MIRFYTADDWVWVFADDRCVHSGHSISGAELLRCLQYESFETHEVKSDLAEDALWSADDSSLDAFPREFFD